MEVMACLQVFLYLRCSYWVTLLQECRGESKGGYCKLETDGESQSKCYPQCSISWNSTGGSQGPLLVAASLAAAEIMVFTFPFEGINMQARAFVSTSAGWSCWYLSSTDICTLLSSIDHTTWTNSSIFPCRWNLWVQAHGRKLDACYGHFNGLNLTQINHLSTLEMRRDGASSVCAFLIAFVLHHSCF